MSTQVLSLSLRPKTFATVIGQDKLIARIRKHVANRNPNVWLFIGQKGSGKTTLARIMAISYQCTHQKKFGLPCKACRKDRSSFNIDEINAAKYNKKEDFENLCESLYLHPQPGSQKRVLILNEIQRVTGAAQDLFLEYTEDLPSTTVIIMTTTEPQKILGPLQSRCTTYQLQGLQIPDIKVLVAYALEHVGSDLSAMQLADALAEKSITSPRLILNAVEKYLAGADPEDAVQVDVSSEADTYKICRNLVKGDWNAIRLQLAETAPEDARGIRLSVAGYLKAILLDEGEFNDRGKAVANAITDLTTLPSMEDSHQLSATIAVLYRLSSLFSKYKH
jgi:DNA polymerase III gamma/tau subunit